MRFNYSSSRSIKRKRFDDEIVEYSLGLPPAQVSRVARSRTHSQTVPSTTSVTVAQSTPPTQVPAYTFPEPTVTPCTVTAAVATPTSEIPSIDVNPLGTVTPPAVPAAIIAAPPPVVVSPTPEVTKPLSAKSISGSGKSTQVKSTQGKSAQSATKQAQVQPTPVQTNANPLVTVATERRRSLKSITGNTKKNKKSRAAAQQTTKDLGRWKPIDDLSLIVGIQQTNDLRTVHQGVKFSCKFTIQEMQNRWYSLLYDEPISRIAVAAMRNLHPELVENVHSKALYTTQEEELLGSIKSVSNCVVPISCKKKNLNLSLSLFVD